MDGNEHLAPKSEWSDLKSVKIAIGDVVQLQDFSANKQHHYVKLIGYLSMRSILVSHPMNNDNLQFIKKGDSYLVRGFSGTKAYDFNAEVIAVCLAPYPYLHLSFPRQVKAFNMRSAMRIKCRLVCSIKSAAAGMNAAATIDDMSITGLRIQSKTKLGEIGNTVDVSFRLPVDGVDQLIVLPAVIRNVGIDNESGSGDQMIPSGLEFLPSEGSDLNTLQYYIYKNLAEK